MTIELIKFGTMLLSRQLGYEAFSALQNTVDKVTPEENITIDFKDVITFSPSWGDEFLTPLFNKFGDRITLANAENSSVQATLHILTKVKNQKI